MNLKEWNKLPVGTVVYWTEDTQTLIQYEVKINDTQLLIIDCVIFNGDWSNCAGEIGKNTMLHWYKTAPLSIQNKFFKLNRAKR